MADHSLPTGLKLMTQFNYSQIGLLFSIFASHQPAAQFNFLFKFFGLLASIKVYLMQN